MYNEAAKTRIGQKGNVGRGIGADQRALNMGKAEAIGEQSSKIAAGTLNLMKTLSATLPNTGDKENLQSFSITRREKVVSVKMEMPREALMLPDAR